MNKTAIIGVPKSSNSDNVGHMLINFGVTEEAGLTSVLPHGTTWTYGDRKNRKGRSPLLHARPLIYILKIHQSVVKKNVSFLYISRDLKQTLAVSNIVFSLV